MRREVMTMKIHEAPFPIGAWVYASIDHFDEDRVEEWRELGLTLTLSPSFTTAPDDIAHMRRILDWSQARGIRLILYDPRTMDYRAADYETQARAALADFGDHPATAGFFVHDEPKKEDTAPVIAACNTLRRLRPDLEPFVNHFPCMDSTLGVIGFPTWPEYLDHFIRASGVTVASYDCYEQMGSEEGIAVYYRNLELYRSAAERNGIVFWNTICSVAHFDFRLPTEDDIRWQFYTSLAYGCKGILYFFVYMREPHNNYRLAPVDEFWQRTPLFDSLRRVNRGCLRYWGDLLPRWRLKTVAHWPKAPVAETRTWQPGKTVASVAAARPHVLISEFEGPDGESYVMVVNDSQTQTNYITIGFRGDVQPYVRSWNHAGEERRNVVCRDGSSLHDQHYAPGQAMVFRLEPAT